jgi:hypothetical protein
MVVQGVGAATAVSVGRNIAASGSVEFGEGVSGNLEVLGDVLGTPGQTAVHFNSGLHGQVLIGGGLERGLWIDGDVLQADAEPAIGIDGSLTGVVQVDGDVARHIVIGGDVAGTTGTPAVHIAGELNHQLRINGSLDNDETQECTEIYVGEMPDPPGAAAVVVNWDGFGWDTDVWGEGATIAVGEVVYQESDPVAQVMVTTCQKGDLDGSGATDNFDITPFVQALTYGDEYDKSHPAIAGARDFHGDCNCDESFDNFDITPFVLRVTDEAAYFNQYAGCGCWNGQPREDSGGGGSFDAPTVAAVLEQSVDREWMPHLIRIAEYVRDHSSDESEVAFWVDVLAELE